jgi:predicted nucleic acid-binding protein
MSGEVSPGYREFVDTNIVIYAYDRTQGPKHERARALMEQLWYGATRRAAGTGVVSHGPQ